MADEPTSGTQPQGQPTGAGTGTGEDVSTAALLAGLKGEAAGKTGDAAEGGDAKPEAKTPAAEGAGAGAEPDDEESDAEDELEEEPDDDDDEEEPAEEPEDDADQLAAKDPELAKRLRVIRQTEQRHRTALDRDRATFDRERSDWQAQARQVVEAQKRFEALVARAKYDPAGALAALGVSEEDFEYAGQQVFARSKKASADPKYRDAADRAMREREHTDELRQTRAELDEVKKDLAKRDQAAAAKESADLYLRRIVRKADDATPRVKALIATNPKRARAELGQTAIELADKAGGAMPKAKDVLAAHEKKIARHLRDYGVGADTPAAGSSAKPEAGKKAAPAAAAKPGGKKPAAPAPAEDETPADPKAAITIPSRDDLLRELRAQRGSN